MAYQTRQRDPLLDSETQAILERRGSELIGLALLGAGLAVALMLGSYSPEDPSWLSATDEPARNILGRIGASIASPLVVIAGLAAWGLAATGVVWGLRLLLHRGAERATGRLLFAPIAIALLSIYASTHVPTAGWSHSFGLGGLFGDTVLGALLGMLPVSAALGLRLAAFVTAVAAVWMSAYVLGFTRAELAAAARWGLRSLVFGYAALLRLLGRGAVGAVRGVSAGRSWISARRAARSDFAEHDMPRHDGGAFRAEPPVLAAARQGLLGRAKSLMARREAEPELMTLDDMPGDTEGRISSRIAEAVRARGGDRPAPVVARAEPPVVRRAPERDHDPVELYDEDDFDLDDYAMPEPELVEGRPALTATPMFETGRSPEAEARRVVQHPPRKAPQPSQKARAEAQPSLFDQASDYETPPLNLLMSPETIQRHHLPDEALEENARMLESVLDDYGVKGDIVSVRPGPVVTMYELEPAPGLKASRVIGLADDIARSMSALSARVSTVPGRSVIGIELPNAHREKVVLREILSARDFGDSNMRLPLALGKDIGGEPIIANLAKMPHLLIAGTTGSGKSVAINTMILSLLYKLSPEECRLIMIDPKMLELSVYDGIPHLLSPVVTDPKKAVVALKWVVGEMEERYRKMSKMGVRNIEGFNGRVRDALAKGEMFKRTVQTGFDDETGEPVFETEEFAPRTLPYIVVIVDEMADLMMVAGKEIEACIQRLAQMARASGIHLIMATQRPSVDVITGTIKANFPTRISFQVTSKIDSRTILGEQGAEQLLGMGDMLYMAGGAKITRIHGPFVSDEEVEEIVTYLKGFGPPEYMSGVTDGPDEDKEADIDLVLGLSPGGNTDLEDALYDMAVQIVIKDRKCSTSYIQRKLAIGYNKAARLVEQMEEQGVVTPANHVGKREILVPEQ
jgi:DNA segregation ATPase FtsK/SpoIIIE, S-DNA-T family